MTKKERKRHGSEREYTFISALNEQRASYAWFVADAYKPPRILDNKGIDITIPIQTARKSVDNYLQIKSPSDGVKNFIIKHGARFRNLYILDSVHDGIRLVPRKDRDGEQPHKQEFPYIIIVIVAERNNQQMTHRKANIVLKWIDRKVAQKKAH
ncbi:MAG: hypothetical protein COW88_03280 [Candidatus Lloydbacteria bacterium CG22_combo_CG10-13_8_21_14_all_47_15]|uniref:Uncharacterized protein n=1 Tax=Candidatus Lloydbacteria bacterium CG22_combo_CG10-13_8_21_14_all_47_15 TaxID=1974635 RepID=A0A2H0CUB4_9BACT|nr:MAG: hypothetical protein COW88_03280 [Candidatus Lloydbacteria bacterium CG22_combo_CG10-13_8_21_14_all_47_15]